MRLLLFAAVWVMAMSFQVSAQNHVRFMDTRLHNSSVGDINRQLESHGFKSGPGALYGMMDYEGCIFGNKAMVAVSGSDTLKDRGQNPDDDAVAVAVVFRNIPDKAAESLYRRLYSEFSREYTDYSRESGIGENECSYTRLWKMMPCGKIDSVEIVYDTWQGYNTVSLYLATGQDM